MSTIVKGLEIQKEPHLISNNFAFIDNDDHVFIVGDEDTIINISSLMFAEYKGKDYESIEEFLRIEFDTQLAKILKNLDQFDIEVIIK